MGQLNFRARWFWNLLIRTRVPKPVYYWLLDLLTDNDGWRPLGYREDLDAMTARVERVRSVSVTLVGDTSGFDEAMRQAGEQLRMIRWRNEIRRQRTLGRLQVDLLASQAWASYGWEWPGYPARWFVDSTGTVRGRALRHELETNGYFATGIEAPGYRIIDGGSLA